VESWTLGRPVAARTPRPLVIAATSWVAVVAVGTLVTLPGTFAAMSASPLAEQLALLPDVSLARVTTKTTHRLMLAGKGAEGTRRVVQVQLFYRGTDNKLPSVKHAAASAVLWHAQDLGLASDMQLTVTRGWDLDIARWTDSQTETHPLDAWRAAD
jgi:hypothetical protein